MRMTPKRDASFITSSPLRNVPRSAKRAVGVLMSPPADATKKRSRVHGDVHGDAADSSTAATNEPVNETSNVDDNTVVRVDANPPRPVFASPVRPAKPGATAAADVSVDANASASAAAAAASAAASATSAAATVPPPRRRVARNLNFAATDANNNNNSSSGDTNNGSVTPPSQLPASITTRAAHSPHSPYRQPTLESHGNAPASLLDLFSPPAKAAPPSDDEVSGSQIGRQSLRRSLTRRMSAGRLGASETLSESLENEPVASAAAAAVAADDVGGAGDDGDAAAADDEDVVDDESFAGARDSTAGAAPTSSTEPGAEAADSETGAAAVGSGEASQGAASDDSGDEEAEFDPYLFIAQLPPMAEEARPRHPVLPARKAGDDRPTLVLDLDETLVHCSIDALENADFSFPVVFNEVEYKVYVRQRPHFVQFLRDVIAYGFEIVVFTASQRVYADALLHLLDPSGELIEQRLFRDSCVQVAGNFIKDLSVLGRDLARMAIIDNSPQTFGYQLDNGIPIESWFEDSADTALLQLLPLLRSLSTCADVRPLLRDHFQLASIVDARRKLLLGYRRSSSSVASQATQTTQTTQTQ